MTALLPVPVDADDDTRNALQQVALDRWRDKAAMAGCTPVGRPAVTFHRAPMVDGHVLTMTVTDEDGSEVELPPTHAWVVRGLVRPLADSEQAPRVETP